MNQELKKFGEFRNKYYFMTQNYKSDRPLDLLLPNDIFSRINSLSISGNHKAFAFALYCTVKATTSREAPHHLPISELKELWGYASTNKTLNPLIKKDGILDKAGLLVTKTVGISNEVASITGVSYSKITSKEVVHDVDFRNGNFFSIPAEVMLISMFNHNRLGTVGFYIYSFICLASQLRHNRWSELSANYISNGTGISESSIKAYLKELLSFKFILIRSGKNIMDDYGDFLGNETNMFLPVKNISKVKYL